MALSSDLYRLLEDIVGSENISDEPAILDSYAFQLYGELMPGGKGERFIDRPEAVVLPGSTEEVQAIVRLCNKHGIKFKAFSTGWGVWGGPGSEGIIQLDLRRMNRILEINEKNMYAVVEPYVTGARLQAELMKRGLNCQIITAGSNVSALPLTAMTGDGFSSVSTSMHHRNILGVEWVLPGGELLRLGSPGTGAGWFCGDGPGPSLRSLLRGSKAIAGGLGVFTRAATKVYHWPGPQAPPSEIEGVSPHYALKPLPETHIYYPLFPSWEKLAEAGIKIAENELAYLLAGFPSYELAANIATSNEESAQLYSEILKSTEGRTGLLVMISANSRKEFDYREKVLKRILAETEGECLPLLEEDDIQGRMIWHYIRVSGGVRQYVRATGANAVGCGGLANWSRIPDIRGGDVHKAAERYLRDGLVLDDGQLGGLSTFVESGHWGMSCANWFYDPIDRASSQATVQMSQELDQLGVERYRCTRDAFVDAVHDIVGPLQSNYHLWLRKVKKTFDPNLASDPTFYIKP